MSTDVIDDDDEAGGDYETVSFERQHNLMLHIASAPTYAAPQAPTYPAPQPPSHLQQNHSNPTQDELDDIHDYEKVRLGQYQPLQPFQPEHAKEFGVLPLRSVSQTDRSPEKYGSSLHKPQPFSGKPSSVGRPFPPQPSVSPPSLPGDQNGDRMEVLSFPARQKSASPAASDDAAFANLDDVRRHLFNSARESVLSDLASEAQGPSSIPRAVSQTIPASTSAQHGLVPPQGEDKSYFDHLFPTQQPTPPSSNPLNIVDNDTYWDHLASQSLEGMGRAGDLGTQVVASSDKFQGEYVLAKGWQPPAGTATPGNSNHGDSLGEVDSLYDVIKDPEESLPRVKSQNRLQVSGCVCNWWVWFVSACISTAD